MEEVATEQTPSPSTELMVSEPELGPPLEYVRPGDRSLTVLAKNPVEMAASQAAMIDRVLLRIQQEQYELNLAQENLDHARRLKIKTAGWARLVTKHTGFIKYYEKVLQALKAGYFVVPDLPIAVIAVRTNRVFPTHRKVEQCGMSVKDEPPALLPAGEGEYVAPEVLVHRGSYEQAIEGGKTKTVKTITPMGLDTPNFPFKAVRPEVLSELSNAQKLRLFDLIGVYPNTVRSSKRDPMLIGIITTQRERMDKYRHQLPDLASGHKRLSFLLKWWLDLDSL